MNQFPEDKRLWADAIAEKRREEKEHYQKLANVGYQPKSKARVAAEFAAIGVGTAVASAALFASGTALGRMYKKQPVFGEGAMPLLNSDKLRASGFAGLGGVILFGPHWGLYNEARHYGALSKVEQLEKESEEGKSR